MRKQELMHTHSLLFEIAEYFKQEDESAADLFDSYEAQSTRPEHIHRKKGAHTTAINHLLRGCVRFVRTSHQHRHTPAPDHRLDSMSPSNDDVPERSELGDALITGYDGANVYVLYPLDSTDEEIKTMWIRCEEGDLR